LVGSEEDAGAKSNEHNIFTSESAGDIHPRQERLDHLGILEAAIECVGPAVEALGVGSS
jgi:hypothetical protein